MFKSLYMRVVIVYLGVVIFSVFFGLFSIILLFWETNNNGLEDQFREQASLIQDLYEQTQPVDISVYMEKMAKLAFLRIELYDSKSGEIQQFNWVNDTILSKHETTVTVPWIANGKHYEMTIRNGLPTGSGVELLALICVILITGILLVLIATRYLVKPVKALTTMANKISKGDFSVRLPSLHKDELGKLSGAINQMAKELGQLETERQEFIANVSHEFQSPLTSIKGFSDMIYKGEISELEKRQALLIIIHESDRLSRLSDNLLKLASLDADKHSFHPTNFDVSEQIRRAILIFEPQWTDKQLQVEMDAKKTFLIADEDLISQIWTNLMSNAVKFTPPGGKIKIDVRTIHNHVEVRFFDSGAPIPMEQKERIFNRFHKTDPTRDRKVDGNGLGLSIVKKIVEIHKGSITVCTENSFEKSFLVILPSSFQ